MKLQKVVVVVNVVVAAAKAVVARSACAIALLRFDCNLRIPTKTATAN